MTNAAGEVGSRKVGRGHKGEGTSGTKSRAPKKQKHRREYVEKKGLPTGET